MLNSPIVMKIIGDNIKMVEKPLYWLGCSQIFVIRTGTLKFGGYVDVLIGNTSIHTQERFQITHLEQSFESFSYHEVLHLNQLFSKTQPVQINK